MNTFRTPSKIQVEPIECGAVSFWILLGFYKKWITTEEARKAVNITKDGSTAYNIVLALKSFGFESDGFQLTINELRADKPLCRFPCIAWVNKIHWIVIEGFDGRNFLISDPAKGHRIASPEEFTNEYSGLVLTAWPKSTFKPSGIKPNPIFDLINLLETHRIDLVFYIVVGFASTIPVIALSTFVGYFTDTLLIQKDLGNSYIWLLVLLVGIAFLFTYIKSILMRRLHLSLLAQLIEKTFQKLLSLPLDFYPLRDIGELSQRITLNINLSKIITGPIADSVIGILSMIVYLVIMLSYNWILGLLVLILGLIVFYSLINVASSLSQLSQKGSMSLGKQTSNILYITNNFISVKSNGQEISMFQQWSDNFSDSQTISKQISLIQKRNNATTSFIHQLSDYLIVIVSGIFILMGRLSIGEFLSFRLIANAFLSPINTLAGVNSQFSSAVGDINRLKDLWDAENDNSPIKAFKEINALDEQDLVKIKETQNKILCNPQLQIEDLNYRFSPNSDSIFNSLNMTLNSGDVISITGPPGSGKTTLLQCLAGLLEPSYKSFKISTIPISNISSSYLTSVVAYLSQTRYIYTTSVLNNIQIFDNSISLQTIHKTIDFYNLNDLFLELPEGLETTISSTSSISATSKTLIHILRMLVRRPRILLIDDTLGTLDPPKSKELLEKITRTVPIVLFVSRDPHLISLSSRSLVLNNGTLIETNTSNIISNLLKK